jgi:ribosomal protein S24E
MNILKEIKNDLFKRREVKIILPSEKTPSYAEVSKLLSEKFNSTEECIVVNKVQGRFGAKTFLIEANIYDSKEDKEKTERKPKEKKEKTA